MTAIWSSPGIPSGPTLPSRPRPKIVSIVSSKCPAGETSTELVLRQKGKEVGEFYELKTKGRISRGGWKGSRSPVRSSVSQSAGTAAGRNVNLGGRKAIGA